MSSSDETFDQHKIVDLLSSTEGQLNQVLRFKESGILGIKATGKCAFANEQALKILGLKKAQEIIGQNLFEIIKIDNQSENLGSATQMSNVSADPQLHDLSCLIKQTQNKSIIGTIHVEQNPPLAVQLWLYPLEDNPAEVVALLGIKKVSEDTSIEPVLEVALERCRSLIASTQAILWEYDVVFERFTFISPQVVKLFGFPLLSWYSRAFWEQHIHPVDQQRVIEDCKKLSDIQDSYILDYRMLNAKQETIYIRDYISVIRTPNSEHKTLRGLLVDITQEKGREEQLNLALLAFEASDPMVITDIKGIIVKVNQAFCELSGYSFSELIGKDTSLLQSDKHDQKYYQKLWDDLRSLSHWQGEIWDKHKSGEVRCYWLTITAAQDSFGDIKHYIGVYTDISERRAIQAKLQYQANFDSLTGLANRGLLFQSLVQAIKDTGPTKNSGALLLLDLDDFKFINDSLGHQWGDKLLQKIAKRLQGKISEGDLFSRIAGDEFALLIPSLCLDNCMLQSILRAYIERITSAFTASYHIKSQKLFLTVSIGVTIFRNPDDIANDILRQADTALYHAKNSGKDKYCIFTQEMSHQIERGMSIRNDLSNALKKGQLMVYLQPVMDINRQLVSAEALLRWKHPSKGFISPVEFIPIAEKSGLIVQVGEWVFKACCDLLQRWLSEDKSFIKKLAINVSCRQFINPSFFSLVKSTLKKTGIPPHMLEFELTEEVLVGDFTNTAKIFQKIKNLGINIAIDDFGTGYSSLSYLKKLPIDKLKIDRSFVMDIQTNKNDEAIVKTIIAMASTLKLKVTAEGVETEEQAQSLQSFNCDFLQGYYFSRPIPIDEFESFARQYHKKWLANNKT